MEDEPVSPGGDVGASSQAEPSVSDDFLPDQPGALVDGRGRVPAAQVLGANYRTLASCCDTRQVPRRTRRALADFKNTGRVSRG